MKIDDRGRRSKELLLYPLSSSSPPLSSARLPHIPEITGIKGSTRHYLGIFFFSKKEKALFEGEERVPLVVLIKSLPFLQKIDSSFRTGVFILSNNVVSILSYLRYLRICRRLLPTNDMKTRTF